MEEKEEKGFTVRDRRTFSSEAKEEAPEQQAESAGQKPSDAGREEEQKEVGPLPELDFASFIISLATTVQVSLGAIPHPETKQTSQNLPAAKQMIDILGMLKEKTKGNLNEQEQTLLDQVLFNLRMHYVRIAEKHQ